MELSSAPLGMLVKLAPDAVGKVAGNLASGIVPLERLEALV